MPKNVAHFAIHADDLVRARSFYGSVFGWKFEGYGGPDMSTFCKIKNELGEEPGPIGAMQHRKFNVLPQRVLGSSAASRSRTSTLLPKRWRSMGERF
jgi:hypothetical protein